MSINYNISLSGLKAAEYLIQTAQNNISNAQNKSYARQVVDINVPSYVLGKGNLRTQLGNGAIVDGIQRVTDEISIQQFRTNAANVGLYYSVNSILSMIEMAFGETGDNSISDLTLQFFNSFQEASKFPEQSSYRVSVVTTASMLVDKIKEVAKQMDTIKTQTDDRIATEIAAVNNLLSKIAEVNAKIEKSFSDNPNGLLDERDKYLDELSKYIDVTVTFGERPADIKIVSGNATLISGKDVSYIQGKIEKASNKWILGVGNIALELQSGSLKGLLETRNVMIDRYVDQLNIFTAALIQEVNNLHQTGFGLDGTTGINFFEGSDIRTISVNEDIITNPEKIALSDELGVSGNGEIAKKIYALQEIGVINGKTIPSFYQEFVIELGNEINSSKMNEIVYKNVQTEIEAQRQSVQGVNIDDEIVEMLGYQRFYQANARTLSITMQILDEILSIL